MTQTEEETRFILELEFIQLLSNPQYLQFLAQSRYFDQPEFVNYLNYLTYFTTPEYCKYVTFPYCLKIIQLLQHKEFRESLKSFDAIRFLHTKQYRHWDSFIKEQWENYRVKDVNENAVINSTMVV